jgi:hypothetical protein
MTKRDEEWGYKTFNPMDVFSRASLQYERALVFVSKKQFFRKLQFGILKFEKL